jgi:hypothetical protein
VAVTNGKRNKDGGFSESDTDSKSDSEPEDDDELEICARESWPSTSDSGDEGLAGPTSHLPGYVGGAIAGLVTQPDATIKNNKTETPPRTAVPRWLFSSNQILFSSNCIILEIFHQSRKQKIFKGECLDYLEFVTQFFKNAGRKSEFCPCTIIKGCQCSLTHPHLFFFV